MSSLVKFSNKVGPAGSFALWGTLRALEFRNPEEMPEAEEIPEAQDVKVAGKSEQKRSSCESLSRRITVEFIAIPVLLVASLVEGAVRFPLGLVQALFAILALFISNDLAVFLQTGINYTFTGGLYSLYNSVNLVQLFWTNMAQGNGKVRYRHLTCGA